MAEKIVHIKSFHHGVLASSKDGQQKVKSNLKRMLQIGSLNRDQKTIAHE